MQKLIPTLHIKSNIDYKARVWLLENQKYYSPTTKGCDIIDLAAASKQQSYDYDKNFYSTVAFIPQQQLLVLNSTDHG